MVERIPGFIGQWGEWLGRENFDLMDDSKSTWLLNVGISRGQGWAGKPTLMLRRFPDHIEVILHWDRLLPAVLEARVLVRFGGGDAYLMNWELNNERNATGITGGNARDFISDLARVDRFIARIEEANGDQITCDFSVAGLEGALKDLEARGEVFR